MLSLNSKHMTQTHISRHSRHKTNRFPASASVRGLTTGKRGLLPQYFHHTINVAVVILLFTARCTSA